MHVPGGSSQRARSTFFLELKMLVYSSETDLHVWFLRYPIVPSSSNRNIIVDILYSVWVKEVETRVKQRGVCELVGKWLVCLLYTQYFMYTRSRDLDST